MTSIEVQEDHQTVRSNHRAIGTLAPPDDVNVHLLQNFDSAASEIINFEGSDMVHNNPYFHTTSSPNKNNSNSSWSNSIDMNTNSTYSSAINISNPKFRSLGPNTGSSAEIQGNHFDLTTMSKASPFFHGVLQEQSRWGRHLITSVLLVRMLTSTKHLAVQCQWGFGINSRLRKMI